VKPERYFSVDIESSGPIPGRFSMLSIGACVVGNSKKAFYVELKPISRDCVPAALEVSGFDLDILEKDGQPPEEAMKAFRAWVEKASGDHKAVFVGFNACYDWQFVNWYLESFTGGNPFGFGGIDIKSYYMGLSGETWARTTSSQLPQEFQPDAPQTHNALEDARAQASIFHKLLARAQTKR
jgi:ribonuclease T